ERQPRELAVVVELGIVEVGGRLRLGDRRRGGADVLLLGHRDAAGASTAARDRLALPSCEGGVAVSLPGARSLAAYRSRARKPSRSRRVQRSRKLSKSSSRRAFR